MQITVLQGSPHKNGSSNMLAASFVKGAQESGHSVMVLDVAHMDMHPCMACGFCRSAGKGCGSPELTKASSYVEEAYTLGKSL